MKKETSNGLATQTPTSKPAVKVPLSEALAAFMKASSASRPEVMKALWVHIKANSLQDPKKKTMIVPDAILAPLLGTDPLPMMKMSTALKPHFPKKKT